MRQFFRHVRVCVLACVLVCVRERARANLGMKVLVKDSANECVVAELDPVLLGKVVEVGVVVLLPALAQCQVDALALVQVLLHGLELRRCTDP